jgi:hypothetical protein
MGNLSEYPPFRTPRLLGGRYPSLPLRRSRGIGLLNELPQLGLHQGPGQQPVFFGYGDDDGLPHHAVLALAISCEKRPDRSSPSRVAPVSKAAFLALASSEDGLVIVSRSKVLITILFLPHSCKCFDGKTARALKV